MANGIELEGMDELIAKLESLAGNKTEIISQALSEGAKIIQKGVSEKIPRSSSAKDHAADHISISKVKHDKDGKAYVTIGPTKGDSTKFFYIKFIEWGTVKMAAAAPFGRTLAEEKQNVRNKISKVLKERLGL